jgi:hypothetical protein
MAYEVPSTRNSNEVTYEVPNMQKEVFAACVYRHRTYGLTVLVLLVAHTSSGSM